MSDQVFALVTGASSGIGRAFALELAHQGQYGLLLLARREERLVEVKKEIEEIWAAEGISAQELGGVSLFRCDLASLAEREAVLKELERRGHDVELLINNAGFGSIGSFSDSRTEHELSMVEVNCTAMLHFCRHFIPRMEANGGGAIINLCSAAAFQPMPYMATYAATKAFVLSFSLALGVECKEKSIAVVASCPGPTESEFHIAAGLRQKMAHVPVASAEKVVREALRAVNSGRSIVVHGWSNKLLAAIARVLPYSWSARLVAMRFKRKLSEDSLAP